MYVIILSVLYLVLYLDGEKVSSTVECHIAGTGKTSNASTVYKYIVIERNTGSQLPDQMFEWLIRAMIKAGVALPDGSKDRM